MPHIHVSDEPLFENSTLHVIRLERPIGVIPDAPFEYHCVVNVSPLRM
jgi:hypothetical protein